MAGDELGVRAALDTDSGVQGAALDMEGGVQGGAPEGTRLGM